MQRALRSLAPEYDSALAQVLGRLIELQTLAIMRQQGAPQLKALVDVETKRLIREGLAQTLCQRRFEQPIPPKGAKQHLPVDYSLSEFYRHPNDFVPN